MPIQAVQHVRRMRGGAQSHLMRCADGHHYVVKFPNNPQHPRVLVNDWLGTRLRELILSFKNSPRNPFPNWREVRSVAPATSLRSREQYSGDLLSPW